MVAHTCCVTGHRHMEGGSDAVLRKKLGVAVEQAAADGYTHFISGFADGVDLLFAEIVVKLQEKHPITLEAAIPHRGRLAAKNKRFLELLDHCHKVSVTAEGYHKGCFLKRNRQMVEQSGLVIAVYDGRETGGTAYTVALAKELGREVWVIQQSQTIPSTS